MQRFHKIDDSAVIVRVGNVYKQVSAYRRGIGIELKPSYFAQAKKNLAKIGTGQQAIA